MYRREYTETCLHVQYRVMLWWKLLAISPSTHQLDNTLVCIRCNPTLLQLLFSSWIDIRKRKNLEVFKRNCQNYGQFWIGLGLELGIGKGQYLSCFLHDHCLLLCDISTFQNFADLYVTCTSCRRKWPRIIFSDVFYQSGWNINFTKMWTKS